MTKNINIFEVAKQLATMASADGVISSSERHLLKEFAEANDIDSGKLIRMAYAMASKVDLPEVERVDPPEMKGLSLRILPCRYAQINHVSNLWPGVEIK